VKIVDLYLARIRPLVCSNSELILKLGILMHRVRYLG